VEDHIFNLSRIQVFQKRALSWNKGSHRTEEEKVEINNIEKMFND